ncbi:hypothetical protein [Chenggangzhangella methanolivorans]|nr:hypothetical protein [Chenggangzhangella methanolivorans]
MSMWLSAANAWSGAARGAMAAEMQRQQSQMRAEATRQMTTLWFPGAAKQTRAPARSRRARRK